MFHVKLKKFYPQKMFRNINVIKKNFPGNIISFGNNFFNMNSGELIIIYNKNLIYYFFIIGFLINYYILL